MKLVDVGWHTKLRVFLLANTMIWTVFKSKTNTFQFRKWVSFCFWYSANGRVRQVQHYCLILDLIITFTFTQLIIIIFEIFYLNSVSFQPLSHSESLFSGVSNKSLSILQINVKDQWWSWSVYCVFHSILLLSYVINQTHL